MNIRERDKKIFFFANSHGYITCHESQKFIGVGAVAGLHRRLKQLEEGGFFASARQMESGMKLYFPTKKALGACADPLNPQPVRDPGFEDYERNNGIKRIDIAMGAFYTDRLQKPYKFIPARRRKSQLGFYPSQYVPGIFDLFDPQGKEAIEYINSVDVPKNLRSIVASYGENKNIAVSVYLKSETVYEAFRAEVKRQHARNITYQPITNIRRKNEKSY